MPKSRKGNGQEPVAERNHVLSRVQHEAADKIVFSQIPKYSHAFKIGGTDPLRSLDLYAGNRAVRTFENKINLFVVSGAKVKKIRPHVGEGKQFARLRSYKVLNGMTVEIGPPAARTLKLAVKQMTKQKGYR